MLLAQQHLYSKLSRGFPSHVKWKSSPAMALEPYTFWLLLSLWPFPLYLSLTFTSWHSEWPLRHLLLVRKAMKNLDNILKSRDITLPTKVYTVKAMIFLVVIYACESWTIKKAECQRIDAFELWCWRRLLRVPWTTGRSNQSILKEINLNIHLKDWCWSWSINTLAIWCKELTHWKDAGEDWGQEEKGATEVGWHHRLNGLEFEQTPGDNEGQGSLECCSPCGCKESEMT